MTFDRNNLRCNYSTEDSSLLDDFYIPTLKSAVSYDRAVGYFSAGMLSYALQGLVGFAKNNGVMRLIIGDALDEPEYNAIKEGASDQDYLIRLEDQLRALFENDHEPLIEFRLNILSWMVRSNALQIRLAVRPRGMYHEKMGILTDELGNCVVFQGSANETLHAMSPDFNFESISIYPSWKEEIFEAYGEYYKARFERLWNNQVQHTYVIDLPSDAYELIRQRYRDESPPEGDELEIFLNSLPFQVDDKIPHIPNTLSGKPYELKSHQQIAIRNWYDSKYKGIFALATGAGKTIAALHAAVRIFEARIQNNNSKTCLIISVPYQILGDQWTDVAKHFGISVIQCYRSRVLWERELATRISNFNLLNAEKFLAIVVVHKTLGSDHFQRHLCNISNEAMMFIGDECHHDFGRLDKLPDAAMKLGLSATPWSHNEHERQQALTSYYGNIVARYTIDDAINDGVLSKYRYFCHFCEMSAEETEDYQVLDTEIRRYIAMKQNGAVINERALQRRLADRARLLGSVEEKFSKLLTLVAGLPKTNQNLFYCGDGSTDLEDHDTEVRDINRASRILYDTGWTTSQFTARVTSSQRRSILSDFNNGDINAMVAIRVLDEGIDIPECSQAFLLASSRNERQYVQRRGRVLRKSSDGAHSIIHDFVVVPNGGNHVSSSGLVRSELKRMYEFYRVSTNSTEIDEVAVNLANSWGLDISEIKHESQHYAEGESIND